MLSGAFKVFQYVITIMVRRNETVVRHVRYAVHHRYVMLVSVLSGAFKVPQYVITVMVHNNQLTARSMLCITHVSY
jgi:hypothetical protein